MHCVSNLKSGFDFTAIFQIIMAKYSKNTAEQIQNKILTPELRIIIFITHYKNKERSYHLLNLRNILSVS